jgi:hypothetical protein
MKKVLIGGAGGPASEGVINSLLQAKSKYKIVGMGADASDLALSNANKKYLIPMASDPNYVDKLMEIVECEHPDLIHVQNDNEVVEVSKIREMLHGKGVNTFLPSHSTIETCVNKWRSYEAFSKAGIKVPKNILINNEADLSEAFDSLSNAKNQIWLRANVIGGGGMGALPTSDYNFAKSWIDHHNGWSKFIAAEMLTKNTVTWMSIWHEGRLVIAQTRSRGGWVHGNRTLSGVTGVTKIGRTISDPVVTEISKKSIFAVDSKPHGIFGVDLAYDENGIPNPTEINIGRFFTTVLFFTQAGVNFPEIYSDLALSGIIPDFAPLVNPLQENLLWFRGMDSQPRILSEGDYLKEFFPQ